MGKENVRKFFTEEQEAEIIAAIRHAELNTSGEIRVHLEEHCKEDVLQRATHLFGELNMHNTALRNGVLFYLATLDKKFAVVGDEGIHQKVEDTFWQSIRDEVQADFKSGNFTAGLAKGIAHCGDALRQHFPYKDDDVNELPDEISTS